MIHLQPHLKNNLVSLRPLSESDFESLYALASDPDVWAQHPTPNRYQRPVFENYFKGAMESGGALLISEKAGGFPIGCSRFYEYDPQKMKIAIGYTFLGKAWWGGNYNPAVKKLMLDYIFQFVESVHFHVGSVNRRSQIAIERLGATKLTEQEMAYYGESNNLNFIYEIRKADWIRAAGQLRD